MKRLMSDGTICLCRRAVVSNGLATFAERYVPYQDAGCKDWTKYREDKIFHQAPRTLWEAVCDD